MSNESKASEGIVLSDEEKLIWSLAARNDFNNDIERLGNKLLETIYEDKEYAHLVYYYKVARDDRKNLQERINSLCMKIHGYKQGDFVKTKPTIGLHRFHADEIWYVDKIYKSRGSKAIPECAIRAISGKCMSNTGLQHMRPLTEEERNAAGSILHDYHSTAIYDEYVQELPDDDNDS